MSPQVLHSLRQVAILIAIAALGVVAEQATGILSQTGLDPVWYSVVMSAIAAVLRWLEGVRDANRAEAGKVIESDVAFNYVKNAAVAGFMPLESRPVLANKDTVYINQR